MQRSIVWVASCVVALVLAGCGDDSATGAGGSGGTAGTGGTGGTGGMGGSGVDAAVDAIDAPLIDAPMIDAPMIDAAIDGPVIDAGPSDVTGTRIFNYVIDTGGTQNVPDDLSASNIAALVPDGSGGFTIINGTGTTQGMFTIPQVPAGEFYLRLGNMYVVTTAHSGLDLGLDFVGRADAVLTSAATHLTFNLTNMTAWNDGSSTGGGDFFVLYSSNAGGADYNLDNVDNLNGTGPTLGATSLSNYTIDYNVAEYPYLINAGLADNAVFAHLITHLDASGDPYNSIGEVFTTSSLTQTNGQASTVSGAFTAVTQQNVTLDWRRGQFPSPTVVNPNAIGCGQFLHIRGNPGGASRGDIAPQALLFALDTLTRSATTVGTVQFGNPYPSAWAINGIAQQCYHVPYSVGGATNYFHVALILNDDLLSSFAAAPITPACGPPTNPTINGTSLFTPPANVGLAPTIAWNAPTIGSATSYVVVFHHMTASGGATHSADIATIYTDGTRITVPPGILQSGEQYVVRIRAVKMPAVEIAQHPLRLGFPYHAGALLSAMITP